MERYGYISGHFLCFISSLLLLFSYICRFGSVCYLKRYSPLKENSVTSACIERALAPG